MRTRCRIHRLPRPCRECAAANSRPRKRFLGTPRPGWQAVLPADKVTALAPDWTAGVRGGSRFVKKSAGPSGRLDDASAKRFMRWVRAEARRLEWRFADLETRAGVWPGIISKVSNGHATLGAEQQARIERVLEAAV